METLGDRIRKIRKQLDMNADEFGNMLGVKSGAVYKYEGNHAEPSAHGLKVIADLGKITIDELVTGEVQADNLGNGTVSETELGWNGNVLTSDDREMLDLYRNLPPEKREVLKLLVNQMLPKEKKEV